jgi:hypothetical protein
MKPKLYMGCFLLLAVSGSVGQQRPQGPRLTGCFSNMRYIRKAGDVVGTEVWIVYARSQYWAIVQEAGGEPNPPVVVRVEVSGLSKVKFTISTQLTYGDGKPAPDSVTRYEGTVNKNGLLLSTPELSGSMPTLLKRGKSYWQ